MRAEYNIFGEEEEATKYHCLSWAIKALKQEPVKTGKWINDNGQTKCSICGNPIPIRKVVLRGEVMWEDNSPVNYCMNCGAKMGDENGKL